MSLWVGGNRGRGGGAVGARLQPGYPQSGGPEAAVPCPTFALPSYTGNTARECMSAVSRWFRHTLGPLHPSTGCSLPSFPPRPLLFHPSSPLPLRSLCLLSFGH